MAVPKKDILTVKIAEKNGNDADLVLLDEITSVEEKIDATKSDLQNEIKNSADAFRSELDAKVPKEGQKGDKGEKGDQGEPGKTPTGEELTALIKPLIPPPQKGDRGDKGDPGASPDFSTIVAEVLNRIPAPDLSAFAEEFITQIQTLEAKIKAIPERPTTTIFGPGKTKIIKIDLSDQLNGSTKQFHLGTHFGIVSVDSSSAPFGAFRENIDYKESGRDIVFTANVDASVALAQGQSLIVKVLK